MSHISITQMGAFYDELQKEAGILGKILSKEHGTKLRSGARFLGNYLPNSNFRRLALGAGTGAVIGGSAADDNHKLRGALIGAGVGGGLTGGAILSTKAGREAAKKSLRNFHERQLYGFTGKFTNKAGKSPEEQLAYARSVGLVPKKAVPEQFNRIKEGPSLVERVRASATGRVPEGARARALRRASEEEKLHESAFHKGYSSIPGVLHAAVTNPGDLVRTAWRRGGTMGKAFAGLGAYQTAKGLYEKPEQGGPGRLEKGLEGAGSALGWLVAPHAMIAGQVVGEAGGSIGRRIGKVGDWAARRSVPYSTRPLRTGPSPYAQYGPYTQQARR